MKLNPYLEVIIASLVFGTVGIFVKLIDLSSTTISFFRLAVPTLVLILFFTFKRNNILKNLSKAVLLISFLNAIRIFLWLFAYVNTTVGNAVLILYTWPIFTVLLSSVMLKEKLTGKKLLLSFLAFMGIVIIFSNKEFSLQNKDFIGMAAMLLSAFLGAMTTILYKKQLSKYSTSEMIFYQNVAGVALFLPFMLTSVSFPTFFQAVVLSIYSIIVGILSYILWFSGLRKMKASTLAIITYSEVFSAIILGVLVLNEQFTWNMIVGGGIILVVSYLARKVEPTATV